ncbi:MAG: hypothetical protein SF052_17245 [Bacteroidia bacterium]|nr:hypothetical protein [Bacteroidia bacterium]
MKNQTKNFILIAILIIVISIAMDRIVNSGETKLYLKLIAEIKANQEIVDSIGGYQSFRYRSEKQIPSDSILFIITIYGKTKNLTYSGKAGKSPEGEWGIKDYNPADFIIE